MALFHYVYSFFHKKQLKGKDRLYQFFKKNNLNYLVTVKTKTGLKLNLDPCNYVDSFIIKNGSYENEVYRALCEDVNDKTILWDIGANIGFHSLSFKHKFNDITVYSFEPDFKNFSFLKNNMLLNNINIKIMNFALSDKLGVHKLHTMDGNNGMSTLNPYEEFKWNKFPHHILSINGDYLVENQIANCPTIIKLDVEGHELSVLKGMKNILSSKKVTKIIFEESNDFLQNSSELKDFLFSNGYTSEKLEREENAHHSLSNYVALLK